MASLKEKRRLEWFRSKRKIEYMKLKLSAGEETIPLIVILQNICVFEVALLKLEMRREL